MRSLIPIEHLVGILNNFKCTRNEDIQDFIRNKALEYENREWCSTYVLINEEKLVNESCVEIDGYFTLSNKVIQLSDEVSNSKKRKLFKDKVLETTTFPTPFFCV